MLELVTGVTTYAQLFTNAAVKDAFFANNAGVQIDDLDTAILPSHEESLTSIIAALNAGATGELIALLAKAFWTLTAREKFAVRKHLTLKKSVAADAARINENLQPVYMEAIAKIRSISSTERNFSKDSEAGKNAPVDANGKKGGFVQLMDICFFTGAERGTFPKDMHGVAIKERGLTFKQYRYAEDLLNAHETLTRVDISIESAASGLNRQRKEDFVKAICGSTDVDLQFKAEVEAFFNENAVKVQKDMLIFQRLGYMKSNGVVNFKQFYPLTATEKASAIKLFDAREKANDTTVEMALALEDAKANEATNLQLKLVKTKSIMSQASEILGNEHFKGVDPLALFQMLANQA